MEKWFLFTIILFLLDITVHCSNGAKFTIVPSPDSPCPGEFTGEPCLTLQQYVANPSLSSNIRLDLLVGNHRLDSQLSVSSINSFTMSTNTSATIVCGQQLDLPISFNRLQQVHVSGITFIGCSMNLRYITNATLERSSFVNKTRCCRSAFYTYESSVFIRLSIFLNNRVSNGAIYGYRSTLVIEQTIFRNNYYRYPSACCSSRSGGAIYIYSGNLNISNSTFNSNFAVYRGHGGAIYTSNTIVTITNTYFSNNEAGSSGHGGAVYISGGMRTIMIEIYFRDNRAGSSGHGGAIYISSIIVTITNTYFNGNRAGSSSGHGGAIYYDGDNITIINSTLVNNRASGGGGGAIYSARRYTIVSLKYNFFSYNMAAYCGVIDVDEFYHHNVNITGNTFTYNRAVGLTAGNNGGGVICIRNASMIISDNTFSHNSVVGDAGVMRVDESNVVIEESIFNNNTAGGDGGVFHTYFYPTHYIISRSTFTDNQAGDDGGVMYVGRAGSHVTISQSTFSHNHANKRGGVVAILGSTLHINGVNNFMNNTAELGNVLSACKSNISFANAGSKFLAFQDPLVPFCTLYDSFNSTSPPTTTPTNGDHTETSATKNNKIMTTTLAPTSEVTSTEAVTIITTTDKHKPTTTLSLPKETTQNGDISPTTHPSTPTTTEDHPTTISTKDSAFMTTYSQTSGTFTVTKDDTSTHTTPENMTTTNDSGTTTTSPITTKWMDKSTTTDTSVEEHTTAIAKNYSSKSSTIIPITTDVKQASSDNPTLVVQASADPDKINLHTIIPGYASLGLSVTLFMLFILMIIVKVCRKKPQPPSRSRRNEYTLIEVQAKE